jgi:hypothetical protein
VPHENVVGRAGLVFITLCNAEILARFSMSGETNFDQIDRAKPHRAHYANSHISVRISPLNRLMGRFLGDG